MNPEDFQENISGQLISIPEGGFAYVPNPLPPMNLTWDSELIEVLSLADRALGELAGYRQINTQSTFVGPPFP
jgi:hypothetical protein